MPIVCQGCLQIPAAWRTPLDSPDLGECLFLTSYLNGPHHFHVKSVQSFLVTGFWKTKFNALLCCLTANCLALCKIATFLFSILAEQGLKIVQKTDPRSLKRRLSVVNRTLQTPFLWPGFGPRASQLKVDLERKATFWCSQSGDLEESLLGVSVVSAPRRLFLRSKTPWTLFP